MCYNVGLRFRVLCHHLVSIHSEYGTAYHDVKAHLTHNSTPRFPATLEVSSSRNERVFVIVSPPFIAALFLRKMELIAGMVSWGGGGSQLKKDRRGKTPYPVLACIIHLAFQLETVRNGEVHPCGIRNRGMAEEGMARQLRKIKIYFLGHILVFSFLQTTPAISSLFSLKPSTRSDVVT